MINRYFRSGAPPVINPLYTRFPRDTVVPGSFAVTLTWILPNRTTGAFNVTSPLPGDWFLAAHLPKDEGKISVKVSLNHLPPTHIFVSCSKANPSVVIYRGPRCCFHTAHVQQTCHSGKSAGEKCVNMGLIPSGAPISHASDPAHTISGQLPLNTQQSFFIFTPVFCLL